MKVNWFGRTYYNTQASKHSSERERFKYKRPVWIAFKMWLRHDVLLKLIGDGYYLHNDCWHHFNKWTRKKVYKDYLRCFKKL